MDAININLTGMSLSEWASTDAQWFYEAEAVQTAYRQGQQARQQADARKRELAAG